VLQHSGTKWAVAQEIETSFIVEPSVETETRTSFPDECRVSSHETGYIYPISHRIFYLIRYHSVHNLLSSRLLSKNVKIRIYKTIILPVVLYGCETWSLPLREQHRLRVFENRVLRRIIGPKRDEVIRGWRKPRNEELHNLYFSPSIIRMNKSRRMR
jgi:hypothetical protein